MIRKSGQNMVEVAILMTVVGVVCIAAYTLLGNNLTQLFQGANNKVSDYNKLSFIGKPGSTPSTPTGTLTTSGQWGGTPSSPITKCVSGSCSIDFGNYILNGVPESLDQIVKSSGSSGANDKMYDLYMQLSNQLAAQGDAAGAQDFKDMANLAKYMASMQKQVETNVAPCASAPNKTTCYQTNISSNDMSIISVPPELTTLVSPASSWNKYLDTQLLQTVIGNGRTLKAMTEPMYTPSIKEYAGYAFIEKFDKIMNNSSFPSNLKGLAKELYLSVADINEEFYERKSPYNSMPMGGMNEYDPITGAFIQLKNINQTDFLNPSLSSSNTSSSLTCASSNPSSSSCHQNL